MHPSICPAHTRTRASITVGWHRRPCHRASDWHAPPPPSLCRDAWQALALFLFGAEPQIFHAQHRVLIDTWIELRISPRTAVLFKALRKQLQELLETRIANLPVGGPAASEDSAHGGEAYAGAPSADAGAASPPEPPRRPPQASLDTRSQVVTVAATPRAAAPKAGAGGGPPTLGSLESKEAAQEAILSSLVYLIGKGLELQADEVAAAALAAGKKPAVRR